MWLINQRSDVPEPTGEMAATASLIPSSFFSSEFRWYASSDVRTARSSPATRGGFSSGTRGSYRGRDDGWAGQARAGRRLSDRGPEAPYCETYHTSNITPETGRTRAIIGALSTSPLALDATGNQFGLGFECASPAEVDDLYSRVTGAGFRGEKEPLGRGVGRALRAASQR